MKTLLVASLLATLIYLIVLPFHQYRLLRKATTAAGQGTFDIAELYFGRLRTERPNFFYTQSKLLCSQITIQHARALANGPNPSFGEAAGLLAGMATRCDASIYEAEAQQLVETIAARHLAVATETCHRGEHGGALRDFQMISTVPYPERILLEAGNEAAWCRVDYARELGEKGWYQDAMRQIVQAISGQEGGIRLAALNLGRSIVEREVNSLLDQGQHVKAFKTFSQRRKEFTHHPELVTFFYSLQQQLDFRIFGLAVGRECRDNGAKLKGRGTVPPSAKNSPAPDILLLSDLALHNETRHSLRIVLKGRGQTDFILKSSEKKDLRLEPGEYLAIIFSPQNCRLAPLRTAWILEPFVSHAIALIVGSETKEVEVKENTNQFPGLSLL